MRGRIQRSSGRVLACVAFLGAAGIGGVAAGFYARPGVIPEPSTVIKDMSPADTVSLRFPADWNETGTATATPAILAFASADGSLTLFNPRPIYPLAEIEAPAADKQAPAADKQTPSAGKAWPSLAEASEKPTPAVRAATAGPAKITLASATSRPVLSRPRSNAVLNDSQIASIKKRLSLTPDQERYWPAVEAELRKMEYKKDQHGKSTQGTRMAAVDMTKVDVEGLKSAGFPLVMSFNDDQRRELKSLAHLLGLDSVMSGL
jgi:hypothetical protein